MTNPATVDHPTFSGESLSRRAFTLIELLVTIAIIAILVAMAMPAVNASRATARQMECRGRLMRIGLALQTYHDAALVLPPGTLADSSPVVPDASQPQHAWTTFILPMLDLPALHRAVDYGRSIYAVENDRLHGVKPIPLQCPASQLWTGASYVGIHHHEAKEIGPEDTGLLFQNSRLSWDDVADGRSSTLMVAETTVAAPLSWATGTRSTLRYAAVGQPGLGDQNPSLTAAAVREGDFELDVPELLKTASLSSDHGDFSLAVLADGRVTPLSIRIDERLLASLAHRDDGEPIEGAP